MAVSKRPNPPSDLRPRLGAIAAQWLGNETPLYVIKRLLQALFTLLLASALCFVIAQLAPGDFLDQLRQNPQFSEETIQQYVRQYGLDRPLIVQYWQWVVGVVTRGDFGESFTYNRPVLEIIASRVPATLLLAIISLVITWAIAIPLGVIAAVRQNQWSDRLLRLLSYIGQGLPSFVTALILLLFAQLTSPLFPVGGMTSIDFAQRTLFGKTLDIGWHLILPAIALSIAGFASLQRLMRGQLLDILRQDYIRTARAKGLPENRVIYIHAFRNAINPLITLLGFEFASLLGGAFVTEFFFNWPGLGRLTLQAVQSQDLYLTMASLMMGAAMLIVGNLCADLLLKAVDPRIQLSNLN